MKSTLLALFVLTKLLYADGSVAAETLAKASRVGDLKTLDNLLSSGVSADLPDRYGRTPIYYAASFSQTKAVELLLTYHADANPIFGSHATPANAPPTPLQAAAELGNRQLVSVLIDAGARVNEKGPTGRTALHSANDQLDVIHLLLEKGADVNARDEEGTSPLDEAIWYGSFDTAALLLAHGARLNEAEPKTGATPINEAAYQGHARLVQYLLLFKPDLATADKRGYGPLENAIRMGKEDCAVLLLEASEKDNAPPEFFDKLMDAAIRKDEPAVVEGLLKHGADANRLLATGSAPLDVAAFEGSSKIVGVLLKNGADPNAGGRNGSSPLEDAALKGFAGIAGLLLERGARVNEINGGSGMTALYSAASFGKGEVVKLLLERGANPNLCGKNGKTAYSAALENGFSEVAGDIRSHGGGKSCELGVK